MPEQRTGDDAPPRPEDFDIPTIDELDAIRTAYNLSQKELSRRAKMEPKRFGHILRNDVDPQTETMRDFLGVLKEAEPRGPEDVTRTGPKPAPSTHAETLEETDPEDVDDPSVRTDGSGTAARSEDDTEHETVFLRTEAIQQRMQCTASVASNIETAFVTVSQLADAAESDSELTEYDGIGPKTADKIEDWWQNREEREEQSKSTTFTRTGSKSGTINFLGDWSGILGIEDTETDRPEGGGQR